jgi:hypothetical protein
MVLERICARGGVVDVVYVYASQEAKAGVCWVVGWRLEGMEWPLNIVFRPGNSEDNAVAWRG